MGMRQMQMKRSLTLLLLVLGIFVFCGVAREVRADMSSVLGRLGDDVRELERLGQELEAYRPAYDDGVGLHRGLARKVERCALHLDTCRDLLFLGAFADEVSPEARERFIAQLRLGLDKYTSMLQREQSDMAHMLMNPDLEADPFVTRNTEDARSIVNNALSSIDSVRLTD